MKHAEVYRQRLADLERFYAMGWVEVSEYETKKAAYQSAIYQWEHGE